jgi:hypothetical protein
VDKLDQILMEVKKMSKQARGVVQFGDLSEIAAEFLLSDTVARIQAIRHTESSVGDGMVLQCTFGVAVRAFAGDGSVLAWYKPAARGQVWRSGDHDNEEQWRKADQLREQVEDYLSQCGVEVRPGVIYIDPKKLMYGGWEEQS